MQISNRSLLLLLVAAVALVAAAVWLTLRPPAPPSRMTEEEEKITIVDEPPDVRRSGGSDWLPEGPVKIMGAENTLVRLDCDGLRKDRSIKDGKAEFDQIPPGGCDLLLLPEDYDPENPPEIVPFFPLFPGDNVTCRTEGIGRICDAEKATRPEGVSMDECADYTEVVCDGSLAEAHAATVVAWSQGPGIVTIDGEEVGPVPVENYKLPVGRHKVEFKGERARSSWTLTVEADEFVEILFHSPTRDDTELPRRPDEARLGSPTGSASGTSQGGGEPAGTTAPE